MDTRAWSAQQLTDFVVAVSAADDEASATVVAVQRAAAALDADVAAIVCAGEILAAVGYQDGASPVAELEAVRPGLSEVTLEVPGVGPCVARATVLEHPEGATLVVGRAAPTGFTPEQAALLRAMGQVASMTLQMLRVLDDERTARSKLRSVADEQAALRRVATAVAGGVEEHLVFDAVAAEVGRVLPDVDVTWIGRYHDDETIEFVGAWSREGEATFAGGRVPLGGHNIGTLVCRQNEPVRVDLYRDDDAPASLLARNWARSAAGTPINVAGHLWGVMTVGSREASGLPAGIEFRLAAFTALVSTAIANAQARDDLRRLADEQAALRRVATLVARGEARDTVFTSIADEVQALLPVTRCRVVRSHPGGPGEIAVPITVEGSTWGMIVAGTTEEPLPRDAEEQLSAFAELAAMEVANAKAREELRRIADEQAALRRVATLVARAAAPSAVFAAVAEEVGRLFSAGSAHVARYDTDDVETVIAVWGTTDPALELVEATVAAPITVAGRPWGLVRVTPRGGDPLPRGTEGRLAAFTELVATAIANAEAQGALTASLTRLVTSADVTRRRIERDLNDGPQQQLASLALQLRSIQRRIPPDTDGLAPELGSLVAGLTGALEELQEYARGIHPAFLTEGGLETALRTLTRRAPIPVDLKVHAGGRLSEPVEVAAYYVVSEALTNAAKHARATSVTVDVEADNRLQIRIHDNGIGGAVFKRGSGLAGMRDRVEALGGRIFLESRAGLGTDLSVELPLAVGG